MSLFDSSLRPNSFYAGLSRLRNSGAPHPITKIDSSTMEKIHNQSGALPEVSSHHVDERALQENKFTWLLDVTATTELDIDERFESMYVTTINLLEFDVRGLGSVPRIIFIETNPSITKNVFSTTAGTARTGTIPIILPGAGAAQNIQFTVPFNIRTEERERFNIEKFKSIRLIDIAGAAITFTSLTLRFECVSLTWF